MCPEWSARGFITMEVTPSKATCLHGRQRPQQQYRHMQEKTLTHWKRPWCWERLKAGEVDDRGWDGSMASPTQWTWVGASSRSWWWTRKSGVLQSMGLQRVHHQLLELAQYQYPTISSSIIPFSSCLQSSQHQGLLKWVSSGDQSLWWLNNYKVTNLARFRSRIVFF